MKKLLKLILAAAVCAATMLTAACGKEGGGSAVIATANAALTHGTWSGTTYTSTFMGVKADFGSDWTVTSDSDLASALGISDMSVDNLKSVLSSTGVISELMAVDIEQASVNIMIEDTTKTKTPTGKTFFSTMPDVIKQQFETLGFSAETSEGTVVFCGENTRCLNYVLSLGDVKVYETQVPIFNGDYVAAITFAADSKTRVEELVAMFTKA